MYRLLKELEEAYAEDKTYQLFSRVFEEHFMIEEEKLRLKQGKELASKTLQSLNDEEASYRQTRKRRYIGYLANIAETCDPENDVQVIVSIQTEPNNKDDAVMLDDVFDELHERTNFDTLHTDGNYNNPAVDEKMRQKKSALIQTGIRGGKPNPERIGLHQFIWQRNEEGWPDKLTCPEGQQTSVERHTDDHFVAYFDQAICHTCSHFEVCSAKPLKRKPLCRVYIKKRAFFSAIRKQAQAATGHNPRAAVEATVRSVKHPFRNGKLPVRGQKRMSMMLVSSATMINIRRIWRSETKKSKDNWANSPSSTSLLTYFPAFLQPFQISSTFSVFGLANA